MPSNRLLYVAGALEPFTQSSALAALTRSLPEHVQDAGDFEVRIMMPCYGAINERKHNLHEVIRLSDTSVPMGADTETVSVKVASVPDVQLQVYFMDHEHFFADGPTGTNDDGEAHANNAERAFFFNGAVMETLRKLRWGPDLIHAFGWIGGLLPSLLATTYADDDLFADAQAVFTPGLTMPGTTIGAPFAERVGLPLDGHTGGTLMDVGHQFADAVLFPPGHSAPEAATFGEDHETRTDQAVTLYEQMLGEVPA